MICQVVDRRRTPEDLVVGEMHDEFDPVERRVALKVIKLGMDTREVVARFEAERQALALMDHPSIARVYGGGATEKGRPFFAMELVDGIRVTDYCEERDLATREGIFVGISAGGTLAAGLKVAANADKGSVMLVMLPDTGERYFSTPLFEGIDETSDDEWLASQ